MRGGGGGVSEAWWTDVGLYSGSHGHLNLAFPGRVVPATSTPVGSVVSWQGLPHRYCSVMAGTSSPVL